MKTEIKKDDPKKDEYVITVAGNRKEIKTFAEGLQVSMDDRIQNIGNYLVKVLSTEQ